LRVKAKNAGGQYRQRCFAGSDLQQRFTAAAQNYPDLRFTAAFGRGRYVCPRNLAALASTEPNQQDLLAFLDDDLTPNNQEEQKRCARLKAISTATSGTGCAITPISPLTTDSGSV
jgi:Rad3-related DNA helicase